MQSDLDYFVIFVRYLNEFRESSLWVAGLFRVPLGIPLSGPGMVSVWTL